MNRKYQIVKSIEIKADPTIIFGVLADVESWNSWTKSITTISFVKNSQFKLGGKVKMKQPKFLPAVWTISELTPNKSFEWKKKSLAVTLTAHHSVIRINGSTYLELKMSYEGFLAGIVYRISSRITSEYLTMEISDLKNKCESIKILKD